MPRFEIGFANGDELSAADNLRAFFEQHFHENLDSWVEFTILVI
jgi:hypothetical protein